MNRRRRGAGASRLLRLSGDLLIAAVALYAAFQIRIHLDLPLTEDLLPPDRFAFFTAHWWIAVLVQAPSLYLFGFYDPPQPKGRLDIVRGLLAAVSLQGLLLMGYYFLAARLFPRSVLLAYLPLNLLLLTGWRWFLERLQRPEPRRVAIVGIGRVARELAATINLHHWHGLKVVGYVTPPSEDGSVPPAGGNRVSGREPPSSPHPPGELGRNLGGVDDLPRLLNAGEIDDVILAASPFSWQNRLLDRLAAERPARTSLLMLPGPVESRIGRMRYRWVHDIPLIEVMRESERRAVAPAKRALDLIGAGILLVLAAPLMAAAAMTVRLTSPGSALYRQIRVGLHQREFTLLKFRTMRDDAERETGEVLARPGDARLTPLGAFLRRTRIDELPQLLNVLAGTMSLVGPRPERPGFVRRYLDEVPGYAQRFASPPGLTGLAQVNGDYYSSAQNKLRYDLAYLANQNLWLDLSILFRTVKIVVTSRST